MNKLKQEEDLPTLFRSLRPDTTNVQVALNSAAHEAEQRWPLFKAIAPEKPELTPELSAEERHQWTNQERSGTAARKPALSLPVASDKLTKSLSRMSGLPNKATHEPKLFVPTEQSKPERALPRRVQEAPKASTSILFSAPVETKEPAVEVEVEVEIKPVGLALFGQQSTAPLVSHPAEPLVAVVDDSLASIFSRLQEKEEPVSKPAAKKSSFLSRLGKK